MELAGILAASSKSAQGGLILRLVVGALAIIIIIQVLLICRGGRL
jgi:hypothetical protein